MGHHETMDIAELFVELRCVLGHGYLIIIIILINASHDASRHNVNEVFDKVKAINFIYSHLHQSVMQNIFLNEFC